MWFLLVGMVGALELQAKQECAGPVWDVEDVCYYVRASILYSDDCLGRPISTDIVEVVAAYYVENSTRWFGRLDEVPSYSFGDGCTIPENNGDYELEKPQAWNAYQLMVKLSKIDDGLSIYFLSGEYKGYQCDVVLTQSDTCPLSGRATRIW